MATVVPDKKKIRGFASQAAFERWLSANHSRETEIWLKIYKQASGIATVTYAQALDVALCWGWIDGQKKSFDAQAFLERFCPRTYSADLRRAIRAKPKAEKTFATLNRMNLFALVFRTNNMRTPEGRAKKIAQLVATLASGKPIVPSRARRKP